MRRLSGRLGLWLPSFVLLGLGAQGLSGCATEAACFDDCTTQIPASTGGTQGANGGTGGSFVLGMGGDDTGNGGTKARGGSAALEDAGTACDGLDFTSDVNNCGECGTRCIFTGADGKCVDSKCEIEACLENRYDLNGKPEDGCELLCEGDPDADEVCNLEDDDCDGEKDEGFDLTTDVENCGVCGNACDLLNAGENCVASACKVTVCEEGWWNADGLDSTGCEYPCRLKNAAKQECNAGDVGCGVEACDDVDQDCDGQINEGNPGGDEFCSDFCPTAGCEGECSFGTTQCVGSILVCVPGDTATAEICDGLDNNCDGDGDDKAFDFTSDPLNCNGCGNDCDIFPHALGKCEASACRIDVCDTDYGELDVSSAGCELCPVRPVRAESCNGKDDDCDNLVDEAAEVAATKPATGAAAGVNSFCKQRANSLCNNVPLVCDSNVGGWVCQYPAGVEVAAGKVSITESKCDSIDGNCDGQKDEAFLALGTACNNAAPGVCLDQGKVACDPADATQTRCDVSVLPDPPNGAPFATETCNGLDDNCDAQVDEGTDEMVHINRNSLNFWVDKFEASRPDATDLLAGTTETHLCGTANRLPWTNASFQEAKDACESSSKRLCTLNELEQACDGVASNRIYPYGNSYTAGSCNGIDAAGSAPVPTGSLAQCVSVDGIFDLSGNVSEWTSTKVGVTTGNPVYDIMALHGGSYLTPSNGLTCSFDLDVMSTNAVLGSLGFRCCKDP